MEVTVNIKNRTFGLKFCMKCHIFKPIRAHHCHLCNVCVDEFGKLIKKRFKLKL